MTRRGDLPANDTRLEANADDVRHDGARTPCGTTTAGTRRSLRGRAGRVGTTTAGTRRSLRGRAGRVGTATAGTRRSLRGRAGRVGTTTAGTRRSLRGRAGRVAIRSPVPRADVSPSNSGGLGTETLLAAPPGVFGTRRPHASVDARRAVRPRLGPKPHVRRDRRRSTTAGKAWAKAVDVGVGGRPAHRYPQRTLGRHAHGFQNRRGLQRLRRAGAARMGGHAGLVEAEEDGLGLYPLHAEADQVGHPAAKVAEWLDARHRGGGGHHGLRLAPGSGPPLRPARPAHRARPRPPRSRRWRARSPSPPAGPAPARRRPATAAAGAPGAPGGRRFPAAPRACGR